MGQYPSSPSERDDDLSIATRQDHVGATCHSTTLPKIQSLLSSSSRNQQNAADVKKSFLKLHTADRNKKCILDPSEVQKALMVQADEIMSRERLLDDENDNDAPPLLDTSFTGLEDDRFDGGASVNTGFGSSYAQSDLTTMTSATRPIANTDSRFAFSHHHHHHHRGGGKKRSLSKFSVMANLDGGKGNTYAINEEENSRPIRAPSGRRVVGTTHGDGAVKEKMVMASNRLQKIHKRKMETASRNNDVFTLYSNMMSSCMQPKDDFQIRREECMSVLHLKMKAHLGFYYTQRFLPVFPDEPRPPGLSPVTTKSGDIPLLVSDDSDTSSSSGISQVIEYGSIPPATPVHCSITDSCFMDLAITGSLGLVPRHGHISRSHGTPPRQQNQKSPDHYIVMMNRRSGAPLAVCAMKSPDGPPIVRIYATKQRVVGQRPAASTKQLGLDWANSSAALPLYTWAEIVTEGMFPDPVRFSIYMASGSEGRFSAIPSYQAGLCNDGTPRIKMIGRTDKEMKATGCALISIEANTTNTTQEGDEEDNLSFHIDVAQGIDPALLLCFTAVLDEVMEKNMRLKSRHHHRRKPRRDRAEF